MLLGGRDTSSKRSLSHLIVKCDDSGNVDSYFKLGGVPTGRFQPHRFAMFSDGLVLVSGDVFKDGGDSDSVTAMFDRAGQFATFVRLSDGPEPTPTAGAGSGVGATERAGLTAAAEDGKLEEKKAPITVPEGLAISAPGGNVYLLRGGTHPRLYVISPVGEAIRDFAVPVPAPGLSATTMSLTGDGAIFICFGVVHGGGAADGADPKGPAEPDQRGEPTDRRGERGVPATGRCRSVRHGRVCHLVQQLSFRWDHSRRPAPTSHTVYSR